MQPIPQQDVKCWKSLQNENAKSAHVCTCAFSTWHISEATAELQSAAEVAKLHRICHSPNLQQIKIALTKLTIV